MGELGIEQTDPVAPRADPPAGHGSAAPAGSTPFRRWSPGLLIDSVFARELGYKMAGNLLADLAED